MAEWAVVYGSLHPQSDGLSFDGPISVGHEATIHIANGRFQAMFSERINNVEDFANRAVSVVQGLVDALGFHLGLAVTVEVDGGFLSGGQAFLAGRHRWPESAGRSPSDPLRVKGPELEPFVRAVIGVTEVRVALADIRLAIRQADMTAFHSYRACEAIRQWFQRIDPQTDDKSTGWARLRETLNIDREPLDALAVAAAGPRHGAVSLISESERLRAIGTARTVIAAFVAHLNAEAIREYVPEPDVAQ
jgi:hypothetical protein